VFAPVTPTAEDVSRPSEMSSSSKQLEFQGSMLQVDPTNKRGAIIVGIDESSGSSERESEWINEPVIRKKEWVYGFREPRHGRSRTRVSVLVIKK
jgi:hypothetical protein